MHIIDDLIIVFNAGKRGMLTGRRERYMEENNNATKVKEGLQKLWDSFTDEQKEKAKECESVDELLALAGKLGVELPDELLESVSGGCI